MDFPKYQAHIGILRVKLIKLQCLNNYHDHEQGLGPMFQCISHHNTSSLLRSCRARTLTCNPASACLQCRAIRACFLTHTPRTTACSFTRLLSARDARRAYKILKSTKTLKSRIITNFHAKPFINNPLLLLGNVFIMGCMKYKMAPESRLDLDGCNIFFGYIFLLG